VSSTILAVQVNKTLPKSIYNAVRKELEKKTVAIATEDENIMAKPNGTKNSG
jgi:hypothetical protein